MKNNKVGIILICLCFLVSSSDAVFAFENGDFQFWNTDIIQYKVNDSLKITAEEEIRFGDDVGELYYTHTDGGVDYEVTEGLNFGINYRHVFEKKKDEWKEENRPHFNVTVSWKWWDLSLKNRGRLEYRLRDDEDKDDEWRFRNKLSIKFPWKWTKFELQPYVADEIFVDFYGDKINRNRLYAGFGAKIFENFKTNIYYLLQSSNSSDEWKNYNVLGVGVKIIF